MKRWKPIPGDCGAPFCRGRFLFAPEILPPSGSGCSLCLPGQPELDLPSDRTAFAEALCARFPEQRESIRRFLDAAGRSGSEEEVTGLRGRLYRRLWGEAVPETGPARQALEESFPGCEELQAAFTARAVLAGLPLTGLDRADLARSLCGRAQAPETPDLTCWLGLDCPAEELGLPGQPALLYGGVAELTVPGLVSAEEPLLVMQQQAPAGAAVLCVRQSADADRWDRLPPECYHSLRLAAGQKLLERLERQYPGLSAHIEEMETAAPLLETRWLCPDSLTLTVNAVYDTRRQAKIFRLCGTDGWLPPFEAGQYVTLSVQKNGQTIRRPYSISSSPRQRGYYEITVVRSENGQLSDWLLDEAELGDRLTASCPEGNLYCQPALHGRKLLMLADRRGLMPFIAMVREALEAGLDRDLALLYSCRSMEEAIFHEQLAKLARTFPNFRYQLLLSGEEKIRHVRNGLPDAAMIAELCPDWAERTVFLCGEDALLEFAEEQLAELGADRRRIRRQSVEPDKTV